MIRYVRTPSSYEDPSDPYLRFTWNYTNNMLQSPARPKRGPSPLEDEEGAEKIWLTRQDNVHSMEPHQEALIRDLASMLAGGTMGAPYGTPDLSVDPEKHIAVLKNARPELMPGATPAIKAAWYVAILDSSGGLKGESGESVANACQALNEAARRVLAEGEGEEGDGEGKGKKGKGDKKGDSPAKGASLGDTDYVREVANTFMRARVLDAMSLKLSGDSRLSAEADVEPQEVPGGRFLIYRGIRAAHEIHRLTSSDKGALIHSGVMGLQKILTGEAIVAMQAERIARKQFCVVLVDASGSMQGAALDRAVAILRSRMLYEAQGDAVVRWGFFADQTSAFVSASDVPENRREVVHGYSIPTVRHMGSYMRGCGGGTDIGQAIRAAIQEVRKQYVYGMGDVPDILLVSDCDDGGVEGVIDLTVEGKPIRLNIVVVQDGGPTPIERSVWIGQAQMSGGSIWYTSTDNTELIEHDDLVRLRVSQGRSGLDREKKRDILWGNRSKRSHVWLGADADDDD